MSHIADYSAPGWMCLEQYDDVGSWLLYNNGEASVLELPPGLTPSEVQAALARTGARLKYILASHYHDDHLWPETLENLRAFFPDAIFVENYLGCNLERLDLGGEPLFLIDGPKHSDCDRITVFRGTAMTGDIELETLETCNGEIPVQVREESMAFFSRFEAEQNYRVNRIFSAHLNDRREDMDFSELFVVE